MFTTIDFPGALLTEAWGDDTAGDIAGRYQDANGLFHAFLLSHGTFSMIDFPGAAETAPGWYALSGGINANGAIASPYCSAEPCANLTSNTHGFLLLGGTYSTIDFPGAMATVPFNVNSSNFAVGVYQDTNGKYHGFSYTQ